jgi:LuxR family maltose regulon positive regulatory protein
MSSLLGLFAALPEDLILSRPQLCLLQAWAFSFSGQFDKVETQLREVEKQIQPADTTHEAREILGSIAIIRGLIADYKGDMASAIELAQRSDELLPEEKWAERSIISFVLGDGYSAIGELDKAEKAFENILRVGREAGNLWTVSIALHKLALLKKLQGKLRSVEALYREAIQFASEKGGRQYGSLGATYVGLSDLLREKNELDAARQMVVQAIQNMERWQNPTDMVNGFVTLARISLSQGEAETAAEALRKAVEVSRQGNIFPITRQTLEACQVRLWLENEDLAIVDQWMAGRFAGEIQFDEKVTASDRQMDFLHELEGITMARVFIARNEFDRALHALSILVAAAESAGRYSRLIEIYLLTALALHGSGKRDQALNVLMKSLALAGPEGYVRIFLDEGRPMEELLQACSRRAEGTLKTYIEKLLKAFLMPSPGKQAGMSTSTSKPESLVEPLTGREAEVLRLLTAGLSNQQIAERLYLSEGTVKTHTHNLYGKLGVQSRTRAIARAKELNLI